MCNEKGEEGEDVQVEGGTEVEECVCVCGGERACVLQDSRTFNSTKGRVTILGEEEGGEVMAAGWVRGWKQGEGV